MVKFTPLFVMMAAMSVSALASSSGADSEELIAREFEDSLYARDFTDGEFQTRGLDDVEDNLLVREIEDSDIAARSIDHAEEHLYQRALEQSEQDLFVRSFQDGESSLESRTFHKSRKGRKNRKNRLHRVTVIFDEGLRKGNDEILIRIRPTSKGKKSAKKIGKKIGKKVKKTAKKTGMKIVNAGKQDASKISEIIQSRLKDVENAKKTVEQKTKDLAGTSPLAPKKPATPPSMMAPQMIQF